jgi:hypothetical protein
VIAATDVLPLDGEPDLDAEIARLAAETTALAAVAVP